MSSNCWLQLVHTFFFSAENDNSDEIKKPPKKCALADAHAVGFQMEQDRCFERLMSVLESQQHLQQNLEVDPEVDAFVTGIAFSLHKSTG